MGVRSVGFGDGIGGSEDILLDMKAAAMLFCKGERAVVFYIRSQSCSINLDMWRAYTQTYGIYVKPSLKGYSLRLFLE